MILQLAVGPVFFFILNITLNYSLLHGYAAVTAVVIVDYLFIALAVSGIGRFLSTRKIKNISAVSGSLILIIFGTYILHGSFTAAKVTSTPEVSGFLSVFTETFFLTVSNPLTIVFWTGLFAVKASENNYHIKDIVLFGFAAGTASVFFLGISMTAFSMIKPIIPVFIFNFFNIFVGFLLIFYGSLRIFAVIRQKSSTTKTPKTV